MCERERKRMCKYACPTTDECFTKYFSPLNPHPLPSDSPCFTFNPHTHAFNTCWNKCFLIGYPIHILTRLSLALPYNLFMVDKSNRISLTVDVEPCRILRTTHWIAGNAFIKASILRPDVAYIQMANNIASTIHILADGVPMQCRHFNYWLRVQLPNKLQRPATETNK